MRLRVGVCRLPETVGPLIIRGMHPWLFLITILMGATMKNTCYDLMILLVCLAAGMPGLNSLLASEPPTRPPALEVALWPPGQVEADPAAPPEEVVERGTAAKPDRSVRRVRQPGLTVYLPAVAQRTGAAVLICPGGGYGSLAIDKEGHDVARWLNSIGAAGMVLKYRLPQAERPPNRVPLPLQDAVQALRLMRSRAADWQLDPARMGVIGFSAGGHLAAILATQNSAQAEKLPTGLSMSGSRPDFSILIYPVISMQTGLAHQGSRRAFLGASPEPEMLAEYSAELRVTPATPPTFLVHARDDGVSVSNSIVFSQALKAQAVPHELLLYDQGGHGYGLGVRGGAVAAWPQRCEQWLRQGGWLNQPAKTK